MSDNLKLNPQEEIAGLQAKLQAAQKRIDILDRECQDLENICEFTRTMHTQDVHKLAEKLSMLVAARLNANRVAFLGTNQEHTEYVAIFSHGIPQERVEDIKYLPGHDDFWQCLQDGKLIPLTAQSPCSREIAEAVPCPFCSLATSLGLTVALPFVSNDTKQLMGILLADQMPMDDLSAKFVAMLASQGARALHNNLLYRKLDESQRTLTHQMDKLQMLYDVGRALNFIDNNKKLLEEILKHATKAINAKKGSIMLLDDTVQELEVRVISGVPQDVSDGIYNRSIKTKTFKRGEGIAGQVWATGQPIMINNVASDSSSFIKSSTSRVDSILCVPIVLHQDIIGVLNITNKQNGEAFNLDDQAIIVQVATQAAAAIHNARLYELAVTDSLTHVFIRRHLFQRLAETMKLSQRCNTRITLLMLDIDHFKRVNDTYGHPCGDFVLTELARVLKASVRETDLVGRYGGEEFCMVLMDTDQEGGLAVAERMHRKLEALELPWDNQILKISVSGGLCTFPDQATTIPEIIRKADAALYYSKDNGRNQTNIYDEEKMLSLEDHSS